MLFTNDKAIECSKRITIEKPLLPQLTKSLSNKFFSKGVDILIAVAIACVGIYFKPNHDAIQTLVNDIKQFNFHDLNFYFSNEEVGFSIVFIIAVSISLLYFFMSYTTNNNIKIKPYKATCHFIGLIGNNNKILSMNQNRIFKRCDEIAYLKSIIMSNEKNNDNKIYILSGKSGCGKSTLINLLENKFKKKKKFFWKNCTPFYSNIKSCFDDDSLPKICYIYIFDQVERFFIDSSGTGMRMEESMNFIKNKIQNDKNNIFIFVIRSEYLFYLVNKIFQGHYNENGILKTVSDNTDNIPNIKFIFCENIDKDCDLKDMCYHAFGNNEEKIFTLFSECTLIEKQIFLNILDQNRKIVNDLLNFDHITLEIKNELLKNFYDYQLCSTNNYWTSIRIMYLLAIGRKRNITFAEDDFHMALYDQNDEEIKNCLKALKGLNLITNETKDSVNGYEIIHDYIGETFIDYSYKELEPATRATLEYYTNNHFNHKDKNEIKSPSFIEKVYKFSTKIIIIITIYKIFYCSNFSVEIFLPIYLSFFYGYRIYCKIIIHMFNIYITNILSFITAIGFICSICYDNYWAIYLGSLNALMIGVPILCYSFDNNIALNTKTYFRGFGVRIFIMGFAIDVIAWFSHDKQLVLIILMLLIIGFGFKTHLNNRFYYECYGRINNKKS